ncbi:hypothetical protein [Rhodococcus erythropolis]|nr:hypothetical protein [Rhodococcus erythropolis]
MTTTTTEAGIWIEYQITAGKLTPGARSWFSMTSRTRRQHRPFRPRL